MVVYMIIVTAKTKVKKLFQSFRKSFNHVGLLLQSAAMFKAVPNNISNPIVRNSFQVFLMNFT